MTEVDQLYGKVQAGDRASYSGWVARVEIPLRRSLRSFARSVDVEAVVQEALLRMWVLAPRLELEGSNASLRYVLTLARNLARNEARRTGMTVPFDAVEGVENGKPELIVEPAPLPDPGRQRDIQECLERIPRKPRQALLERLIDGGSRPDGELATGIGMQLNTFLKNIGRARQHLRRCLESRGWRPAEFLS